jgi:hypothetical protein
MLTVADDLVCFLVQTSTGSNKPAQSRREPLVDAEIWLLACRSFAAKLFASHLAPPRRLCFVGYSKARASKSKGVFFQDGVEFRVIENILPSFLQYFIRQSEYEEALTGLISVYASR